MNGELHRALKQIKDLGLVEDLHDRDAVKKILYKRGEGHLAHLVDEHTVLKYEELIGEVDNMKDISVNEVIKAKAEEMGATYKGSMTLRKAMEAVDDLKTIKAGFTQVLSCKNAMELSDGFCAFIKCELDTVSLELDIMTKAFDKCPNVRTLNSKKEKVEKDVNTLWTDYKRVMETKGKILGFINSEFIQEEDKEKYIKILKEVEESESVMDYYLDHCMLAIAEMND